MSKAIEIIVIYKKFHVRKMVLDEYGIFQENYQIRCLKRNIIQKSFEDTF